ncbi:unnamed protein product [Schistosoma rodhaini]|uniref:Reverse transcriptase domain-containing protein n=1 Tax=Schistosoma rodhaini TaxID=6188 RepID=A0AA85ER85_9TREM|nr:unnamed protein product [Schistosoma rodhaini]
MNVHFKFNGEIYRQIDGVAMGSPLGPIMTDIFLAKLENGPLTQQIEKFSLYCRYMDDTFILCNDYTDLMETLQLFNTTHPSIKFTCEEENGGRIAFLDVLLTRRKDDSLKRNINRKTSWTGQYTNFLSFVPLQYKRNLIKTLHYRIKTICSEDTVEEETKALYMTLRENGYPEKFINKNITSKRDHKECLTVNKKPLYIRPQFRGDAPSEMVRLKLRRSIERTFNAGKLQLMFSTRPMITPTLKDKLPRLATSFCIYQFNCSCGASYIGRCSRNLYTRAREHLPVWLSKGVVRTVNSSVLAHLVQTGHIADIEQSFTVIYRVNSSLPNSVRQRILQTAEAIAIRIKKPELCIQKKYVQPLLLPWPTSGSTC